MAPPRVLVAFFPEITSRRPKGQPWPMYKTRILHKFCVDRSCTLGESGEEGVGKESKKIGEEGGESRRIIRTGRRCVLMSSFPWYNGISTNMAGDLSLRVRLTVHKNCTRYLFCIESQPIARHEVLFWAVGSLDFKASFLLAGLSTTR